MPELSKERLERYLAALFHAPVAVTALTSLRESRASGAAKEYGYGHPVKVEFIVGASLRAAVLETTSPGPFGHEHMADRARMMLWDHGAYNALPKHVRSLDVGAFDREGNLLSVGNAEEFFLLVEHVEGAGYILDIARLQEGAPLRDLDLSRADALCDYLVGIHSVRGPDPGLYVRKIRELLGDGECVMGVCDSYPLPHGFITAALLEEDRTAMPRLALAAQGADPSAPPGPRGLPPLQHPLPGRDRLHRAGPVARRVGGTRGRRDRPHGELPVRVPAGDGPARRPLRNVVPAVLDRYIERSGTRRSSRRPPRSSRSAAS